MRSAAVAGGLSLMLLLAQLPPQTVHGHERHEEAVNHPQSADAGESRLGEAGTDRGSMPVARVGEDAAASQGQPGAAPVADTALPGRDWIEEKTGAMLPLDLVLRDEEGKAVSLDTLIDRPTLLLPVYYYCAGSCSRNLANLGASLSRMKSIAGKEFRAVSFSFNEEEKTEDARRARKNFLKLAGAGFPEQEWRFLTADRDAIAVLTGAIGYRFEKDPDGSFIHPSALVAVSGEGKIIRYVYGDFIPGDLDMAVADAARNTPSLSVKRLLDICFNSDPDAGKGVFQAVKVIVLVVFGAAIAAVFLRGRKKTAGTAGKHSASH